MLERASAALSSLRWRTVVLALLALSVVHFIFVDDTLRTAYSTRLGKVDEVSSPQPDLKANVNPPEPVGEDGKEKEKTNAAPAPSNGYADEFPIEPNTASTTTSESPTAATSTYIPTPTAIAPFSAGDKEEYLAICLAVKDQYADLTEWLTHHYHHLNIRRFYIMDDGSNPPLATRNFSAFLDPKAITHRYYHPALHQRYQQLASYTDCLRLFGKKHKWIAFIDADEFFEVRGNNTIYSLLKQYDNDDSVGAFAVNWQIHTSGGLLTRPPSARKGFTRCIEDQDPNHPPTVGTENEHIKVIVKPSRATVPDGAHKFRLKKGARTVGEDGDTVDRAAWRVPITRRKISLHHYATRSRREYEEKIERGNGMGDPKGWNWWKHVEAIKTEECLEMAVLEP